ncbi:O-antigen ligase family protein [Polaribacter sp.]|nr:O-antigen ligase family protein [Polaribacter sp.]
MKVSFLHRTFLCLTFLLAVFPVLTFLMRSIITIVWCVFGILFYLKENKLNVKLNKEIWLVLIPYLMLIVSLFYSNNINNGVNTLVKILSFIVIPIPLFLNRNIINYKNLYRIFYLFSLSVIVLVIYQITVIFFNLDYLLQDLSPLEIKINGYTSVNEITQETISKIKLRRFRKFIVKISNTHTTYQGLWISFTIFMFCVSIFNRKKITEKVILIFLGLLLLGWLYLISSRMPLLALLVSGILTTIFFANFTKKQIISFVLVICAFSCITISFKNPISIRVKDYFNTGLQVLDKESKVHEFNSSNVRNGIYYCSIKLIQDNFIWGVGVGDIQEELNSCYSNELSSEIYKWRDYNTHNQYLFFFVSTGLVGFIMFLLFLFYIIRKSCYDRNFIYFYFIVSVCFMFLTESILERSDGIIFFSFFNSLLLFNISKRKYTYDHN